VTWRRAQGQRPAEQRLRRGDPARRPLPTGDEENCSLGQVLGRGLGIVSAKFGTLAPHLNIGYVFRDANQSNSSVIATVGFDNAVAGWATMAFDLLSEWQLVTVSSRSRPGAVPGAVPAHGHSDEHPGSEGRFLERVGGIQVSDAAGDF